MKKTISALLLSAALSIAPIAIEAKEYKVLPGDTFIQIGKKTGTFDVQYYNLGVDPLKLKIGQTLKVADKYEDNASIWLYVLETDKSKYRALVQDLNGGKFFYLYYNDFIADVFESKVYKDNNIVTVNLRYNPKNDTYIASSVSPYKR